MIGQLELLAAAQGVAADRVSTALALFHDRTEVAEVFQKDAAAVLATTDVVLDKPILILDDLYDIRDRCFFRIRIVYRIEDPVQLAGELVLEIPEGRQNLFPFSNEFAIFLYGQAKGLQAAAGIVAQVARQPIDPANDVPLGTARWFDYKGNAHQGLDLSHAQ